MDDVHVRDIVYVFTYLKLSFLHLYFRQKPLIELAMFVVQIIFEQQALQLIAVSM